MASRNNLKETNDPKPKAASTAFKLGDWVSDNGSGQVKPLDPAEGVLGLCLTKVQSVDPNYATTQMIPIDGPVVDTDRFLMDVTGTATSAMVNKVFDVDPSDSSKLSVATTVAMIFGKVNATPFTVGETITGGTSGATAVVLGFSGNRMLLGTVTGTFQADETITGGTSSATGKVLSFQAGGFQFEITQFITASLVEVKVKLLG